MENYGNINPMDGTNKFEDLFTAIAAKYLARIDADPQASHQHEVGGMSALKKCWGTTSEKQKIPTQFVYVGDEDKLLSEQGTISWYDARKNEPTRSPEWRIYYTGNLVTDSMKPGDFLVIAQKKDGNAVFLVAPPDSDGESSLRNLFSITEVKQRGLTVVDTGFFSGELDFRARFILESMGIEYERYDASALDDILKKYGDSGFPSTSEFSAFSRKHMGLVDCNDSPDNVLLAWYEHEDLLFRTLEKYLIEERIQKGFEKVDDFIAFSLSVINRRKARAGLALENHAEFLFSSLGIKFSRGAITENKSRPDFLFPSKSSYDDSAFPSEKLTMLASKASCKDRWRQVLAEANRIPEKHLLTLQPAISEPQLKEMQSHHLQLVLPEPLHQTYSESRRSTLWSVDRFCRHVLDIQNSP